MSADLPGLDPVRVERREQKDTPTAAAYTVTRADGDQAVDVLVNTKDWPGEAENRDRGRWIGRCLLATAQRGRQAVGR